MPKLAKPKSFDYDTITKIIEAQVKSITELRAAKSKTSQEWRFFDASAWATSKHGTASPVVGKSQVIKNV